MLELYVEKLLELEFTQIHVDGISLYFGVVIEFLMWVTRDWLRVGSPKKAVGITKWCKNGREKANNVCAKTIEKRSNNNNKW